MEILLHDISQILKDIAWPLFVAASEIELPEAVVRTMVPGDNRWREGKLILLGGVGSKDKYKWL